MRDGSLFDGPLDRRDVPSFLVEDDDPGGDMRAWVEWDSQQIVEQAKSEQHDFAKRHVMFTPDERDRLKVIQQAYRTGDRFSVEQWRRIVESFGGCCAYCGETVKRPALEHVVPVARGGKTTADNVVPSCRRCNQSKGSRRPEEWLGAEELEQFLARWIFGDMYDTSPAETETPSG
jgi:5-methylcytosine-specific restriction enzyme A